MTVDNLLRNVEHSALTHWAEECVDLQNGPWLCYISLTNHCNSRCVMCAHAEAMRRERGLMTPETFRRIVDQLPRSVQKVYLMKQGEPFLNPHLEECVQYLRSERPDVFIVFHTNGISAKRSRVEKLLPYISSVGVSISAITPEIYRNVHGTDRFNEVMRNLKGISECVQNMTSGNKPHIFIDYVAQKANESECRDDVISYFRRNYPGIASVDFHWMDGFHGYVEEGRMRTSQSMDHSRFPCCVFPWSAVTFCHDGNVSYCFVEPRENCFMGNILNHDFWRIWNGDQYKKFRKRMVQKNFGKLSMDGIGCEKCSWIWSMHSQSPRNLQCGHSGKAAINQSGDTLGRILDCTPEDILGMGIDGYLKGEIHLAVGYFHVLTGMEGSPAVVAAAERMLVYCDKVIAKYKDMPLWREALSEEGLTTEKRTCSYNATGGETHE